MASWKSQLPRLLCTYHGGDAFSFEWLRGGSITHRPFRWNSLVLQAQSLVQVHRAGRLLIAVGTQEAHRHTSFKSLPSTS